MSPSQGQDRIEDFLWFLESEKKFSTATRDAYRSDLRTWVDVGLKILGKKLPLKPQMLSAIESLESRDFAASTVARKVAALRSFFRYRSLIEANDGWMELSSMLPPQREELPFPKALTLEELEEFLEISLDEGTPAKRKQKLRNRALLELVYASGLRISEAIDLRWGDIDEEQGVLKILGKGSKERFVPYSERAWSWLCKYRDSVWDDWSKAAAKKDKDIVFLSHLNKRLTRMAAWKIVSKRGLECGIDSMHPHVLRHSFATHLLQAGADVRTVQALVGHNSLNTTERYLKIDDSSLQKAFRTLHPLAH